MKARLLLIPLGLAVALVMSPTPGETQAQFQQPSQGGPGGPGGSGRDGQGFDPSMIFDRFSNGKDTISRDQLDASGQQWFDRTMQRMNLSGTTISRQQFVDAMQQRMAGRSGGGPPGGASSGAAPSQPAARSAADMDAEATLSFQRRDRNGDGYLNSDEMSGGLRAELSTWDRNRDGLIDLNEYKAYYRAMQERRAQGGGSQGASPQIQIVNPEEEVKRPTVFRAGNLPAQVPSWFAEFDANQDGQVALYEWRSNPYGWSDRDFFAMDSNNDGFITVEEVLRYQSAQAKLASSASGSNHIGPIAAMSGRNGPGGRNRGPSGWNSGPGNGSSVGYDRGFGQDRGRGRGSRDDGGSQGGGRRDYQSGYDRPDRGSSSDGGGRGRRRDG